MAFTAADAPTRMGRPPVGPRIDFRIPEDAADLIRWWAKILDVPEDQVCRDVMLRGIRAALRSRALPSPNSGTFGVR